MFICIVFHWCECHSFICQFNCDIMHYPVIYVYGCTVSLYMFVINFFGLYLLVDIDFVMSWHTLKRLLVDSRTGVEALFDGDHRLFDASVDMSQLIVHVWAQIEKVHVSNSVRCSVNLWLPSFIDIPRCCSTNTAARVMWNSVERILKDAAEMISRRVAPCIAENSATQRRKTRSNAKEWLGGVATDDDSFQDGAKIVLGDEETCHQDRTERSRSECSVHWPFLSDSSRTPPWTCGLANYIDGL